MQVLYADNHILVVDKPAGMLAQPGAARGPDLLEAARAWVRSAKGKREGNVYVGLVHRLDRNTSGVMVLARTSKAGRRLARQWREHTVYKEYAVLVAPAPRQAEGTFEHWLLRREDPPHTDVVEPGMPGARRAVTAWEVVDVRGDVALVRAVPRTGRAHQIRVQWAAAGCPVLGDVRYGGRGKPPHFLHAAQLCFEHPVRRERLSFEAPLPPRWPPWAVVAWAERGPHAPHADVGRA